jgi:SAM-dependent methyltransferase
MTRNHWGSLFRAWSKLSTPVRVSSEVIAGIKNEVAGVSGPILLLGMTSGLFDAGADVTAIDKSADLVQHIWPGNTPARRAVVADWLGLPFAPHSFAACVGDGSLISFEYPDRLRLLLNGVADCLEPGGRFACRLFLAPEVDGTIADLKIALAQGRVPTFQHFKLSFAAAIGIDRGNPNVRVAQIPEIFDAHFSDRGELAVATGWDLGEVDTIDVYRKSDATYAFPTQRQMLSAIPTAFRNVRFVSVADHPLGAQWPILVMERA